jgi:chorismate mutase/prephenate dehydratase
MTECDEQRVREQMEREIGRFDAVERLPLESSCVVSYSGVPGAFAEAAVIAFFGDDVSRLPVSNFREVMESLVDGRAQYGVLPIENSSAGNVESNYDLLKEYDVSIVGEQVISVNQAVMAVPGTKLSQIARVYSHPQGLMQCSRYLEQTGWQQIDMVNTAVAAKKVRDEQDMTQAAIASQRAAELYGLEILNPMVNNDKNNATRFVVLSRRRMHTADANKIGIAFDLPHQSGSLYQVLGSIVRYNLNMTMIQSRPIPDKQWEYYFFIEFIGNLKEEAVIKALTEIASSSIRLRIIGNYHTEL